MITFRPRGAMLSRLPHDWHPTLPMKRTLLALVLLATSALAAPAPAALIWDDNAWGAIRFTVDHQLGTSRVKVRPAAVLHVRVGSEMNDVAFAAFRRTFAAATYDVTLGAASSSRSRRCTAGASAPAISKPPTSLTR